MKYELFREIIEENRRNAAPFLRSFRLDKDSLRRFSRERGLADVNTVYQTKFMGLPLVLSHPSYKNINQYKDISIHDNGCGLGINARYFSFDGFQRVSASDINRQRIEEGRLLFGDVTNSKVQFEIADARELSSVYGHSAFGIIYDGFILHQLKTIEDAEIVLAEGAKTLKSKGIHFGMTRGTCKAHTPYELRCISKKKTRLLISPATLNELLQKTKHSSIHISSTLIDDKLDELVIYYEARVK